MAETEIGIITRYFDKIGVAAIKLMDGELKVGDKIHIVGPKTDVEVVVDSMQIDRESVTEALPGQEIGIKIGEKVRVSDHVAVVED